VEERVEALCPLSEVGGRFLSTGEETVFQSDERKHRKDPKAEEKKKRDTFQI